MRGSARRNDIDHFLAELDHILVATPTEGYLPWPVRRAPVAPRLFPKGVFGPRSTIRRAA